MKIIHCSDIHLGASMTTHLSMEQANQRKDELLHTFISLVEYAKTNDVQAIMIAGDLLDTDYADIKTRNILINLINSNADINFYYLCGNHDENSLLLKGTQLPSNLFTFSSDWCSYDLGGVKLTGAVLGDNNYELYSRLNLDKDDYNIVLLHGGETHANDFDTPDTVNFDALKNKNIDYLALGHLHSYREGKLDERGTYCYSGCLEGRGFDECGKKGFVLLDITAEKVTRTFIPFARRELHEINIDVTDCVTAQDLSQKLQESTQGIDSGDFVRIIFTGEYDQNTQKYLNIVTMSAKDRFYYFEYKDHTKPKLDISNLEQDVSIAGEFVRTVRASDLSPEEQDKVIMLGLRALNGEEVE